MFAVGIVSREARHDIRGFFRSAYAPHAHFIIRFIVDKDIPTQDSLSDMYRIEIRGSNAHCVQKSLWWLQNAPKLYESASVFIKTDDDSILNLPVLSRVLSSVDHPRIYGGRIGYSYLDRNTTLGRCYGYGPRRALQLKKRCGSNYGPYPFAHGPLVVVGRSLAQDVPWQQHDLRFKCYFEDRIVGEHVSKMGNVNLLSFPSNSVENSNSAIMVAHKVETVARAARIVHRWGSLPQVQVISRFHPWQYRLFECCGDWSVSSIELR